MSMTAESPSSSDTPHRFQVTTFIRRDQRGVLLNAIDCQSLADVSLRQIDLRQFDIRERDAYRARISRQIQQVSGFGHPAVLNSHGLVVEGDDAFIIMDPLATARPLEERRGMPVDIAVSLILQALDAFEAAHRHQLDLTDLRLRNFFVTPSHDLKILEFGITPGDVGDLLNPALARPEDAALMSPEQAVGEPWAQSSNIFSAGCLFYFLLSGNLPFQGSDYTRTVIQIVGHPHVPLLTLSPDLPPALAEVIDRALAKNPTDRFADIAAFRNAVHAAIRNPAFQIVSPDDVARLATVLQDIMGPTGAVILRRALRTTRNTAHLVANCASHCGDAADSVLTRMTDVPADPISHSAADTQAYQP